jgi:hypothetical protein
MADGRRLLRVSTALPTVSRVMASARVRADQAAVPAMPVALGLLARRARVRARVIAGFVRFKRIAVAAGLEPR